MSNKVPCLPCYEDFEDCGIYLQGTGKIGVSHGKKLKNIYHLVYAPENLALAQYNAQKAKKSRSEIQNFNANILENLDSLYWQLKNQTYRTGVYREKWIYDPKERLIMIAPFYPDRIVHHCIINVLGEHWRHIYIENTYACIKGRGTHKCMEDVHQALTCDRKGTKFCLKLDVRKFYDNINHDVLKQIIRHTIADQQMLWLLDMVIDSNKQDKGLPIGNFTSQYLANLYLAYFDHWAKEELGIKYYFRYMDDIVVLSDSKDRLHEILDKFGLYLGSILKVEIKDNWQVFPVDSRGIDYVGFKQNHYGILLRKGILKRFFCKFRKIKEKYDIKDEGQMKHLFPSEYGWIIRCSEEHSKYIITNCLKDEKRISYRIARRKQASNHP